MIRTIKLEINKNSSYKLSDFLLKCLLIGAVNMLLSLILRKNKTRYKIYPWIWGDDLSLGNATAIVTFCQHFL